MSNSGADAGCGQSVHRFWYPERLSDDILSCPWVSRYCEALAAYGDRRTSFAADLSSREDRFHMLLLSSSISCLLFDLRREKMRGQSRSHPPPAARLLGIFMSAIGCWATWKSSRQGRALLRRKAICSTICGQPSVLPRKHSLSLRWSLKSSASRIRFIEAPCWREIQSRHPAVAICLLSQMTSSASSRATAP